MPDALEDRSPSAEATGDKQQPQEAEQPEALADAVRLQDSREQPDDVPKGRPETPPPGPGTESQPDARLLEAAAASQPAGQAGGDNLQRMLDVPLEMTVELGRTDMQLSEVLSLQPGSIIEIDRLPGEPIDLLINGILFAKGEIVVIKDTFGYRIIELVDQTPAGGGVAFEGE